MRKFSYFCKLVLFRIRLEFREGAKNAAHVIKYP